MVPDRRQGLLDRTGAAVEATNRETNTVLGRTVKATSPVSAQVFPADGTPSLARGSGSGPTGRDAAQGGLKRADVARDVTGRGTYEQPSDCPESKIISPWVPDEDGIPCQSSMIFSSHSLRADRRTSGGKSPTKARSRARRGGTAARTPSPPDLPHSSWRLFFVPYAILYFGGLAGCLRTHAGVQGTRHGDSVACSGRVPVGENGLPSETGSGRSFHASWRLRRGQERGPHSEKGGDRGTA